MLKDEITNPKFKGVVQTDAILMAALNEWTNGLFLKRIKKTVLYFNFCGMEFPSHHHFFGIFDLKSQQLFTAGLATTYEKLMDFRYNNPDRHKHLYISKPQVLTMRKLEPGFVIWLASLSLAFVALTLEWLTTLKNYLVMKYVLLAFYSEHRSIRHSTIGSKA